MLLKNFVRLAALSLSIVILAVVILETAARLRPPLDLKKVLDTSAVVVDRNGEWLDAALSSDDKWRFPIELDSVPQDYIDLLLGFEDHRFYEHTGVSYRAIGRAIVQRLRAGYVVSGASTITMQVARLLEGQEGGLYGKFNQIVAARRMNIDFKKQDVLQYYFTLAPYGGNLEGIEAASLYYLSLIHI